MQVVRAHAHDRHIQLVPVPYCTGVVWNLDSSFLIANSNCQFSRLAPSVDRASTGDLTRLPRDSISFGATRKGAARASLRLRSPGSGFAEDLRKLLDCCCRISAKGRWKTLDAAVSIEDLATVLP